jgi:biopolymer transport protein ExbB
MNFRRASRLLSLIQSLSILAAIVFLPAIAWAQGDADKKAPQGFFQIVFSGGPIGILIMLVLIGMSLTMVYLVFENALSIRRKELLPEGLTDQVRNLTSAGRTTEAIEACRAKPSLLAFVLAHGLAEADSDWTQIEKALEDAVAEQSSRLLRKVEYLSVLGNIGPMVGLLGTVVGMLLAFREVAETAGKAGAAQLAEGIYQALVTTVVGLMIAIPALGAFAIFRNRVDQFIAEASYAALHALAPLKLRRQPSAAAPPPANPPPPPRTGGR